ncbi:unnamed protein product [Spirodela intermedia]|uniref:E3 ubiquitin-protein ligase RMA n=1 Tax=Spirodela intermedia TaxID=51605 RepID=A0A7I8INJ0_SPIIN|nr:unnamed protein product [Spirodela intermedia]CAA6659349.1 unnamed protein product [Spirodela intermedia]
MAKDPVVTDCGHLFCWPCLYQWIRRNSSCRECPVCKSPVDIEPGGATVTPIYGCSEAGNTGGDPELPCRPRGRQSRRSLGGAG